MVTPPAKRKTHITRICGTNRAGEQLTDMWVDVLRTDEITIKTQDTVHQRQFANQYQEVTIKLKWDDENGEDGSDETESRVTEIVKICGPDQDPEDPDEWVPVRKIKTIKLKQTETINNRKFLSELSSKNSKREIDNRRFYHYDTNIDENAENAFDTGQKTYRVETSQYEKTGEKDDSQYVEHEVIRRFTGRCTHHWLESQGDDLEFTFKMKNDFLLDESDVALLEEIGDKGFDPPFRLDPFQNIINCQLDGLAVEFDDEEFLELPSVGGYDKGVFAFWFRVPQETFDAAATGDGSGPFGNSIPLVVFGTPVPEIEYEAVEGYTTEIGSPGLGGERADLSPRPLVGYTSEVIDSYPSFIGVTPNGQLEIFLQSDVKPSITNDFGVSAMQGMSTFSLDAIGIPFNIPGSGWGAGGIFTLYHLDITDFGYTNTGRSTRIDTTVSSTVVGDRWHLAIVSFDFSTGITATQVPYENFTGPEHEADQVGNRLKLWVSIDDVNYTGFDIGGLDGGGPNDVITSEASRIAGSSNFSLTGNHFTDPMEYSVGSAPIPAGSIGIPATSKYKNKIKKVEMAEFQFWADITLNTGNVANRRLFIDDDGEPVPPSEAEKVLGKPTVRLHKSGNWRRGRNTGTYNRDFIPNGDIVVWKPDPSLHGPQSPKK